MVRNVILGAIWLSFVGYNLWLAPLARPYTWEVGRKLVTFQLSEVNSYLVAIFWLMGVWPMIYACLMFLDGRMQKVPAWFFFIGANFLGILWLMPYFLLRQRNQDVPKEKDKWLTLLDQRKTGMFLLSITVILVSYAVITGDWQDFTDLFQHRAFVHLITLDFLLMAITFPITALLRDDLARHGLHQPWIFWSIALTPLLGPLLYLCFRPPLQAQSS